MRLPRLAKLGILGIAGFGGGYLFATFVGCHFG